MHGRPIGGFGHGGFHGGFWTFHHFLVGVASQVL